MSSLPLLIGGITLCLILGLSFLSYKLGQKSVKLKDAYNDSTVLKAQAEIDNTNPPISTVYSGLHKED